MLPSSIGRRFFLKVLGAAGLVSGCSSSGDDTDSDSSNATAADLSATEYVIIGSGAGGGPLAANLARAGKNVLLFEAGVDNGNALTYQVPAFHLQSTEDPNMRWDYFVKHYTDQQQQARDSKARDFTTPDGAIEKRVLYPRAGTLGGCTAHNALVTVFPHESDWSSIGAATGRTDIWNADNLHRYFRILENCQYLPKGTNGHGFADPSKPENGHWFSTELMQPEAIFGDLFGIIKNLFEDGGKLLGVIMAAAFTEGHLGRTDAGFLASLRSDVLALGKAGKDLFTLMKRDLNSAEPGRDTTEGLFSIPLATNKGHRNGPREFLVATAKAKSNLKILTQKFVTKLLFDDQRANGGALSAVGLEYIDAGNIFRADPKAVADPQAKKRVVLGKKELPNLKEIILAAGAFNTPQILKLSGIGPVAELKSKGIDVLIDRPGVGENLQDRYEIGVVSTVSSAFVLGSDCSFDPNTKDQCLSDWQGGKGAYISNGLVAGIMKVSSQSIVGKWSPDPNSPVPDLFVFGGPRHFKGYYPKYAEDAFAGTMDDGTQYKGNAFTWAILKAHTANRAGTVKLASKNPWDPPEINFHYFGDGSTDNGAADDDLAAVVEGVKLARQIGAAADQIVKDGYSEHLPGDVDVAQFVKDEAWGHHASCSCRMGKDVKDDPMAVLDGEFKVQGTKGLRVVDASVFPRIPGIFIVVPIYIISEMATDLILGKQRQP